MVIFFISTITLLTKTTAAENEAALCYRRVRVLYSLAVVLAPNIVDN